MKILFAIVIFSVFIIFVVYLTSCNSGKKPDTLNGTQIADNRDTSNKVNHYADLRSIAFSITPDQLGIKVDQKETKVYGVIMEWGMDDATVTVVSFLSGDASLYLSSGFAVIGGIKHEKIQHAAVTFTSRAAQFIDMAAMTETTPQPGKDIVRFYLLTNKGKFVIQETIKNLDEKTSKYEELFSLGNVLIKEIRLVADKKEK